MNNEFEDILNLAEIVKEELILLSKTDKFNKTGFRLTVEDNQFIFIKNNKKITLSKLLRILELN